MKLGSILILPAAALRTTAFALRLFASTGQRLADILSPDDDAPAPADVASQQQRGLRSAAPRSGAPQRAPVDPVRLDLAGLAARPAPDVIAALESLGTLELADLYDYESKHRRRRAVLDAIEAATAPPTPATDAGEDALLADVREPDELVYSTQTPRR